MRNLFYIWYCTEPSHAAPHKNICICSAGDNGNAMYRRTWACSIRKCCRLCGGNIDGICIYYTYFSSIRITYEIWTFSVLLILHHLVAELSIGLSLCVLMFCFIYQSLRLRLHSVPFRKCVCVFCFLQAFHWFVCVRYVFTVFSLKRNWFITNGYYDKFATEISSGRLFF